jgi:hypothetical protein
MALAYSIVDRGAFGDLAVRIVDITLDNAYVAGGWTLDPRAMGFGTNGTIFGVIPMTNPGFILDFVPATSAAAKLRARDASGAVGVATPEIANALAAANGLVVRCLVLGKGHG